MDESGGECPSRETLTNKQDSLETFYYHIILLCYYVLCYLCTRNLNFCKMKIFLKALMCTAVFIMACCTPEKPDTDKNIPVESITLNAESVNIEIGGTYQLEAKIIPENADSSNVTWQSGDPAIATIDANGLVTAIAAGSTAITATAGGKQASCTVNVSEPEPDGNIDMSDMSMEEVRAAINEALEAGITEFHFSGQFEKLGIATDASPMDSSWIDNPFIFTDVEVIDLSNVTEWPEVDVDGILDSEWQSSTDGVYGLPAFAFSGLLDGRSTFPQLRKIILPEEAEAIGSQALWNNPKLESVICPGVKYVGNQCLIFCGALSSIDLPEATTIYTYAFQETGITSISLPKVVEIHYGLFNKCPLTRLELTASGDFTIHEHPFASMGFGEPVFDFDTPSCELVLNADKHYESGSAFPQAESTTNWCETEWGSIIFE